MIVLDKLPDDRDAASFGHDGGKNFVLWSALDRSVVVRINTEELSDCDGNQFSVEGHKIVAALKKNRDFIQARARAKHREGDAVVTLDLGDLTTVWPAPSGALIGRRFLLCARKIV